MNLLLQIIYFSIYNILSTLKSPLFWVVVVIVFLQYRKIGEMEKGILGKYKKSPFFNTLISTFYGLIGGVLGSVIFIYFDVSVNPKDFLLILPLAILLSIFNSRFICFSYAGGIISLISLIFGWPEINVIGIMFVVGVLHLVESFLILLDGTRNKTPIFMERQGEIIGGFTMNRFWPVPFIIFVNNGYMLPITILAVLGYGDFSLSSYPKEKSRETASFLFSFSLILIIFARLSMDFYLFKYIAAIFSPLGHEIIIMIGRKKEENGKCIFTATEHGLRVLDTLPNSIGKKIGLNSGDIILSVNGKKIDSKRDIEEILYFRPKCIELSVFDIRKGYVSKEYNSNEGGINNLGIITVSRVPEYTFVVKESETPIKRLIKRFRKRKARFRN